jgi:CubicO group peptidase (beta-lactamase class C family)
LDADVRQVLAERVEALAGGDDGIGIVVGIVDPKGRRVVSYGHAGRESRRPLDGDTGFEIASVTKVFTALLLADMARRGEVALTDPVAKHLPRGVTVPERGGRSITLLDLATHTSGLPFMPDELPVADGSVTAREAAGRLTQFLVRYELRRDIGSEWDYSNIGYWLLGEALAARAGTDFESLLKARVLDPLGMKNTAITLSPKLKAALAVGHNAVLQPALPWSAASTYADMAAAGGLVSTANDLSKLLAVAMGYEPSPLAASMAAMLESRRPIGGKAQQALGWVVTGQGDADRLISHEGGSWGFASVVAWDPLRRVGLVVLSNQVAGVSDIAQHLLRPDVPLQKPPAARHTEIAVNPALLEDCVGRYEVEDEGVFAVAREGGYLTIQAPISWGLPKLRLRPESSRDFFVAELPLRVTVQMDGEGRVKELLIHPPRGQRAMVAVRVLPPNGTER